MLIFATSTIWQHGSVKIVLFFSNLGHEDTKIAVYGNTVFSKCSSADENREKMVSVI